MEGARKWWWGAALSVTVGWQRWQRCPPARRWLVPLGRSIISEGWVFCRKKDKPTQRDRPDRPPQG